MTAGIYLLSLTIAGVLSNEFENDRFPGTTERVLLGQVKLTRFTSKEKTLEPENWALQQEMMKKLNLGLKTLLEEVESCRENYPNLTDRLFNLRMYGFLLQKLAGGSTRKSRFQCNINTELVDNLRKILHQLEQFQKGFVQNPKNNSTKSPERQTNPQKEEIVTNLIRGERDRNDLTENLELDEKTDIPYVSHIYLGQSLYPIMTEKSFSFTPRSSKIESRTIDKVYELLTPSRWNKNIRTQVKTRLIRTVATTKELQDNQHRTAKAQLSIPDQIKSFFHNFRTKFFTKDKTMNWNHRNSDRRKS